MIFHLLIQRLHRASFGVPSPLRTERWRHRSCTAPIRLQSSLICNAETRFIRRQYFISISIIIRTQEKNVLRTYACWKYHKWHRSGLQILREYHGVGAWALRTSFLKHRDLPWSIRANQCGLKPSFQCQDWLGKNANSRTSHQAWNPFQILHLRRFGQPQCPWPIVQRLPWRHHLIKRTKYIMKILMGERSFRFLCGALKGVHLLTTFKVFKKRICGLKTSLITRFQKVLLKQILCK